MGSSAQQLPSRPAPEVAVSAAIAKPRRQQVSRACEGCRVRRIKCDDARPCRHCQQRGDSCIGRGSHEPRSLAQALREIDRLKQRLRQLECVGDANGAATGTALGASTGLPTPCSPSALSAPSAYPPSPLPDLQSTWEGVFVAGPTSEQTFYYGPSSVSYFTSRVGAYLSKTLHEKLLTRHLQPRGVSRSMGTPADERDDEAEGTPTLPRTLEEYFIGLFWDYYNYTLPILDEQVFREHYASLWDSMPSRKRRNSALVDIVLALAIQYGYTFIPKTGHSGKGQQQQQEQQPGRDATTAGRRYYRRSKSLLAHDLESPSLSTLQCLVFSVAYLCCASFENKAHLVVAQAVRVAQMLGLHLEPSAAMPLAERELRKRTWWVLYTVEAKMSMKLGRPFLMETHGMTTTPASDEPQVANLYGSPRGVFDGGVTWLSYAVQCQKLQHVSLQMNQASWTRYGQIMVAMGQTGTPYSSPATLERCAEFLSSQMGSLRAWAAQVPEGIRLHRLPAGNGCPAGRPFSVECDFLDFDGAGAAPPWLRRSRVCLELLYHYVALAMYRPFISFCHKPRFSTTVQTYTPMANAHASACAHHAAALVTILHHTVTETDLMRGWNEFFLWHWNATITLIGFLLANPVHVSASLARSAIDKAIAVCEVYGADFSVASSALTIARDLTARTDGLLAQIQGEMLSLTMPHGSEQAVASAEDGQGQLPEDWLHTGDDDEELDNFGEFMDWALTVDRFNSFDYFGENGLDGFQGLDVEEQSRRK